MRAWILIVLALVSLLIGLVWKLPVGHVIDRLPPIQGVSLEGASGALSAGTLQTARVQGHPVGPIQWQLRPAALLLARLALTAQIEAPVLATGRVSALPTGTVIFSDWRATADIGDVAAAAGYNFVPVRGQAGVQLESAQLVDGLPRQIRGRVELRGLSWALGSQSFPLGDVEAIAAPEENVERAQIRSLEGSPLEITGEARLESDGRYDVNLRIKATPAADPRLGNLLRGLGRPDSQGYYVLRYNGALALAP